MAIATTPLFSRISGSAGSVDFRTRRNGKIEIGKKRIPSNPQSTEQQNTRNAYGRLHELWQNAAWIDKEQYENIAAAYDISAWNAFLMRHLSTMRLNPAAYWPFVEGTNNTLHDFTVNENHGIISGAIWKTTNKFSIPALWFDGIDDRITIPSSPSLLLTSGGTLNVGYSPDISHSAEPPSWIDPIVTKSLNYQIGWEGWTDGIGYGFFTDAAVWKAGGFVFPTTAGNSYKISTQYDGLNLRGYANGTLKKTNNIGAFTINQTNSDFLMGVNILYFNGLMMDVVLFDYPILTNAESNLYQKFKKFYGT